MEYYVCCLSGQVFRMEYLTPHQPPRRVGPKAPKPNREPRSRISCVLPLLEASNRSRAPSSRTVPQRAMLLTNEAYGHIGYRVRGDWRVSCGGIGVLVIRFTKIIGSRTKMKTERHKTRIVTINLLELLGTVVTAWATSEIVGDTRPVVMGTRARC